jgi:hypothetical protein
MFVKLETLFCDAAPRDVDNFSHYSWLGVPFNECPNVLFAVLINVSDREKKASYLIVSYNLTLSVMPLAVTLIICVEIMAGDRYFLMIFIA